MTKNEQSSTRSGEWLTVAACASALGISERAVQKRCAAGKLAARRIETPQGARWEIDANQVTRTGEPSARTLDASQDANQRTDEPIGREPANQTSKVHAQTHPNELANQRTEPREPDASQSNAQTALNAHLLEENRFLRAAVEQHQRSEAELRAALRTALAAMPKALTDGESSTRNEADTSREVRSESPKSEPMGKDAPVTKNAAQSGLRGEGLRDLRTILRKILGIR